MGLKSIRRIYDFTTQYNQIALQQSKKIFLSQFPYMNEKEADAIISSTALPQNNFHYVVLVAEDANKQVLGIALASHFKNPNFYFLDFIATHKKRLSGGIGGALYERLREEAASTHSIGIFFDCLSDEKELSLNEEDRKQNIARLKFYERYGARPLSGTKYELKRSDHSIFHLVFDGLGDTHRIEGKNCKKIIKEILQRKAGAKCSPDYIKEVTRSVRGTIKLRPARYQTGDELKVHTSIHDDQKIALVINEGHIIHHVRERGYLESPVRIKSILKELSKLNFFDTHPSKKYPDKIIQEVHDKKYLAFLKNICKKIGNSVTSYGDVFPIRNAARLPKDIELQIGYYCLDTSTPLNANAYKASRAAVDCALTAAQTLLNGKHMAYALVRPPGHHAERKYFGGFCYFNSSAIAAQYLSKKGKVAILDIDYHHGNGQQDIFYDRSDVFTVSIHGNPEYAYPYFSGFSDETGEGKGLGYNLNIPLKEGIKGVAYRKSLAKALEAIKEYNPSYMIIALGLDIAKGDPTGTWLLSANDFRENGEMIAKAKIPTLVVQEGGYQNRVLGINARHFFQGLWEGYYLD